MIRRRLVAIFLGLMIVCSGVYAGSKLNIEEGAWEITSQVKMQGMTMPPVTVTQCITKENAVPQSNSSGQDNCKVTDVKTGDNTVSWRVTCSGQGGDMQGKGKITYSGDRFEGQMSAETMGMVMVTQMNGRRTGPCQ